MSEFFFNKFEYKFLVYKLRKKRFHDLSTKPFRCEFQMVSFGGQEDQPIALIENFQTNEILHVQVGFGKRLDDVILARNVNLKELGLLRDDDRVVEELHHDKLVELRQPLLVSWVLDRLLVVDISDEQRVSLVRGLIQRIVVVLRLH